MGRDIGGLPLALFRGKSSPLKNKSRLGSSFQLLREDGVPMHDVHQDLIAWSPPPRGMIWPRLLRIDGAGLAGRIGRNAPVQMALRSFPGRA